MSKNGILWKAMLFSVLAFVLLGFLPYNPAAEGAGRIPFAVLNGTWTGSEGTGYSVRNGGGFNNERYVEHDMKYEKWTISLQNIADDDMEAYGNMAHEYSWDSRYNSGYFENDTDSESGPGKLERKGDNIFESVSTEYSGTSTTVIKFSITLDSNNNGTVVRESTHSNPGSINFYIYQTYKISKSGDGNGGNGNGEDSGGGCNAGFGVIGLFALALGFAGTRIKKIRR